ncbi:PadR family transcriptional regulator [Actinophytocola gossypii]|uniref:PadR family transcriptional regulator n=1 Tax=Actinophytocola gossypii TaxID=2812003 RepID=A0ABT2JA07_9PSEU|nr:PadR family transcriptional regulator [Actinophytocola gossypii]MCT2584706.1 PadR family transcriptional regulator [Actinophytocola gossypii]
MRPSFEPGGLTPRHQPFFGERHVQPPFTPLEARGPFPPPPPVPPFGPWPGGPSFGPGDHHRRGRGHRHGGRRSRRGDVRAAILVLLAERPMHGYEMIQEITERSGQNWRPSPGSVYPTLQLLADEGLVVVAEGSGGKRRYELTDEGREAAARHQSNPPWEQIAQDVDPRDVSLRDAIGQLMGATAQVANAATERQKQRAIEVLNNARRELYAILGEDDSAEPED